MSDLNDPRVLWAAERTLLAWVRTVSGLMAMGFLVDRTSLLAGGGHAATLGAWIGGAFIAAGVALGVLSVVQYRKSVAGLRPAEIPENYWVNMAAFTAAMVAALGIALGAFLVAGR